MGGERVIYSRGGFSLDGRGGPGRLEVTFV